MKKAQLFVLLAVLMFAGSVWAVDFVSTGLSNLVIGGPNNYSVSIRFLAKSNAPLAAVRLYWIIPASGENPGYASGTGGHFSYTLRSDSDGQPGSVLATASMVQNFITENGRGNFPLICFPPASLVGGRYYHIVVKNVDPSPTANWSSLDFLTDYTAKNQTPDVQVLFSGEGGSFESLEGGAFIGSPIGLFYADGTIQGYGYVSIGSEYPGGYECGTAYGFPASICK